MKNFINLSLAILISCIAVWFFADALWSIDDREAILRNQIESETEIMVGNTPPCAVTVKLSSWKELNQMKIYRWIIACEDELNATK